MNKVIIIAGPTASGKTSLSVEIAKMLSTEVISCDSMQIYKNMDIGTAKVSVDEMQGVVHHMIDIVDPKDSFSVAQYAEKAKEIISKLHAENKIPVICGGTGLYVDAILYPLSMGSTDNSIREKLQAELNEFGNEHMYNKLLSLDREAALATHPNNTVRVLRALEIIEITGQPKSIQNDRNKELNYETLLLCMDMPRDVLYERINKRVELMFNNGLENEVKTLLANDVTFDMQSMKAIGYKEFKDYIVNNLTKDELINIIQKESRHYAKRQITWFKRYPFAKNIFYKDIDNAKKIVKQFCEV